MNNDERLQKIMGLGKESSKKTYYPDFKNNLKQLSQEKEKLEAMFNNAINGIIRIELDGKIIASNKSSTKLLQEIFPNFSINNTNALDIFGKELWEEVKEKTLKTRKIDMIEFVVPSKVKNYWLQLNMIYQSPLGIEPYFEAFFQDVTIKKEYEFQLTNMNNYYSVLKILLRRIAVVFIIYQFCRIVFLLFNKSYFPNITPNIFLGGVVYDLSAIGFINLFFNLLH